MDNFYNSNNVIIDYYNLENAINNIYTIDSQTESDLMNYDAQISTLYSELDSLITDSLNNNYVTNVNNKMTEIQEVVDDVIDIYDQIKADAIAQATTLKSQVNALNTPFFFCDYYKTTYLAILDLIIEGEPYVNSTYGASLQSIAEECIFDTGNPIFLAQGLCHQLNIEYSAEENCSTGSKLSATKEILGNGTIITIAPNPTSKNISIYMSNGDKIHNVKILTLDGKEKFNVKYEGISSNETIDVSKLNPSVYLIEVNGSYLSRFIKIN